MHSRALVVIAAAVSLGGLTSCSGTSHAATSPLATNIATKVGLGLTTRTFGAVVFDYDNDGWPDIFLGRHELEGWVFRNDHGHFVRVTPDPFPGHSDRHQCAAGDLNGDGRLDVFCPVGGESGREAKRFPDQLWMQQSDGTFTNEADTLPSDPYGRSRHSVIFDANGDGRPDIFVGNVSPRTDGKPSPNRLFLNEGNGHWRDAPEMGLNVPDSVGGAGRLGSEYGGGDHPLGCLRTLDANGDGWTDVLMCAQGPTDKVQRLHLFTNDHGEKFTDVSTKVGLIGGASDAVVADMNGDGQPDVVAVNNGISFGVEIYLNDHGKFTPAYHAPIKKATRLAVADANGDGHPDIYVMRSNLAPAKDVADLVLVSKGSYRDYTTLTLPAIPGVVRGDDVVPIDYENNRKPAFLVMQGGSLNAAPLQLIAIS